MSDALLTIGGLARATGVSPDLLRAWETRYGFPVPSRLSSGHRRYEARYVDEIAAVLGRRASGFSLEAAIDGVRHRGQTGGSWFAPLRRRWPNEPVRVLSRRAMLALSQAIEDEMLARAEPFLLAGSFQAERFYRVSESRWRDISRTARWAAAFADFDRSRAPAGGPIEIKVEATEPLHREWAIACESETMAVCMIGVERARRAGDERRFEMLWSLDARVVRTVLDTAIDMARQRAVEPVPDLGSLPPSDPAATSRLAESLLSRTIERLDR